MYNAGLSPESTPDPRRAFHLWSSDGAVILTTNRTDAAGMLAGAREVFGPRILVHQLPTTVATDTIPGQDAYHAPVTRSVNRTAGVALELHIDGYLAFGDHYPDLVFLLCERQATAGGEKFIVDGQRLVDAIASDPTQRALSRFLWDIKLELSRPDGVGPTGTSKPVPSRRPVASRTCAGRLTVRRHQHQRLVDDIPSRADDRQHLAAWARLTEEPPAPRHGSCSTPGTCSAWTTIGSSTAASPIPGLIESCTSCGPGATWPSGCRVPPTWWSIVMVVKQLDHWTSLGP